MSRNKDGYDFSTFPMDIDAVESTEVENALAGMMPQPQVDQPILQKQTIPEDDCESCGCETKEDPVKTEEENSNTSTADIPKKDVSQASDREVPGSPEMEKALELKGKVDDSISFLEKFEGTPMYPKALQDYQEAKIEYEAYVASHSNLTFLEADDEEDPDENADDTDETDDEPENDDDVDDEDQDTDTDENPEDDEESDDDEDTDEGEEPDDPKDPKNDKNDYTNSVRAKSLKKSLDNAKERMERAKDPDLKKRYKNEYNQLKEDWDEYKKRQNIRQEERTKAEKEMNESVETELWNPDVFKSDKVVLYHAEPEIDKIVGNRILPTRVNAGTKFSTPRKSSRWDIDKYGAILQAFVAELTYNKKLYDTPGELIDMYYIVPAGSIMGNENAVLLVANAIKNAFINAGRKLDMYCYSASVPSKMVGLFSPGWSVYQQYSLDLPVEYDSVERIRGSYIVRNMVKYVSDSEIMKIAKRENQIHQEKNKKYFGTNGSVDTIKESTDFDDILDAYATESVSLTKDSSDEKFFKTNLTLKGLKVKCLKKNIKDPKDKETLTAINDVCSEFKRLWSRVVSQVNKDMQKNAGCNAKISGDAILDPNGLIRFEATPTKESDSVDHMIFMFGLDGQYSTSVSRKKSSSNKNVKESTDFDDIYTQESIKEVNTDMGYFDDMAQLFDESAFFVEKADISSEMKPIIAKLNAKGYKTKYSSPGYGGERSKRDQKRDGIKNGKLYSTARLMFEGDYNFPPAPEGWKWRQVDKNDYLDVKEITYNEKDGSPDEAFAKWKRKYMASLNEWVDNLDKAGTKRGDSSPDQSDDVKESVSVYDMVQEMVDDVTGTNTDFFFESVGHNNVSFNCTGNIPEKLSETDIEKLVKTAYQKIPSVLKEVQTTKQKSGFEIKRISKGDLDNPKNSKPRVLFCPKARPKPLVGIEFHNLSCVSADTNRNIRFDLTVYLDYDGKYKTFETDFSD